MQIDKLLRLVVLPEFVKGANDFRKVRILQVANMERILEGNPSDSAILKELLAWRRSSPREYAKFENCLRMIVEQKDIPFAANIKRCRGASGVFEIKSGKRRVYCFIDPHTNATVIIAVNQSVNRGNKEKEQEKAIRTAHNLMKLWNDSVKYSESGEIRAKVN